MNAWVATGLKSGIKSTRYPRSSEQRPGVSPGLPVATQTDKKDPLRIAQVCPTRALSAEDGQIVVDYRRCVHCFRCARIPDAPPLRWQTGYEWAATPDDAASRTTSELRRSVFGRSLNVLVVDGGDCGACLSEITQLNSPYYNIHRLGFFITPTPRSADVLLVIGPVTDHMRLPLQKAYDAMPTPKRVVAVGACALSGGVFGPSFVSGAGAGDVVPVDVVVPGCPPPPLAILHGLLVSVQRKPPAPVTSPLQSPAHATGAR
jgi:Ni,Fe-hydrogenase III small subunit/ferredoxin-like protein FixX